MAFYDQLSELPGKAAFMQALEHALEHAKQVKRNLGLLLLDLDGYGEVNERYGPDAGNVLLNTVAERLRHCIRERDVAAYFGEDCFAVLLAEPKGMASVVLTAERIRRNLGAPLLLAEQVEGSVGVSIGIAVYPENGNGADRLMTVADSAMFESKTSGRNSCTVFKGLTHERVDITPWLLLGEEHLLGIPELDGQHEKLASLISDLYEIIKNHLKKDQARADALYDDLIAATELNFETETRMMAETGYPLADAHNRAHKFLLGELRYLKKRIIEVNEFQAFQLLKDWLVAHIEKDDKPMGEYLVIRRQQEEAG